jgi:hypothetical protein
VQVFHIAKLGKKDESSANEVKKYRNYFLIKFGYSTNFAYLCRRQGRRSDDRTTEVGRLWVRRNSLTL